MSSYFRLLRFSKDYITSMIRITLRYCSPHSLLRLLRMLRCLGSNLGIVLWSAIEPNIGVVSACLPSCRPIFRICIRSIDTLKDTTISTLEPRSKGKATVDRHDFVPLVGNRRANGPVDEIALQKFGVQTSIEGDHTGFRREPKIPIDAVHIRSDVKVQDS